MSFANKHVDKTKQQIHDIAAKIESNTFTMLELLVRRENMMGASIKVGLIDDDAEAGPTIYFSNKSNFYKPIEGKLKFGALIVNDTQYVSLEDLQALVEHVAHSLTTRH